MSHLRSWRQVALLACALTPWPGGVAAAQVREASTPARAQPVGTAMIGGTIVTDDNPPKPLRRVVVTLAEAANVIASRVVTSDEVGRFVFRNLPAGRYTITASRAPYLPGAYGARRVAGPGSVQTGTVIALANGQVVTDISVTLMRSSVITGTVRDTDGQPARGFTVSAAYSARDSTGQRSLATYRTATTDDLGVYRLYGLSPGTYLVSARYGWGDASILTEADIQRGMDQQARGAAPAAPPPRRPTVGYAPVYFPGTTDAAQATAVTLGVAEERAGIDLHAQFVPMARVEGTIVGPDGKPAEGIQLWARAGGTTVQFAGGPPGQYRSWTDAQGRFTLSGLPPGSYAIDARTAGPSAMLWAGAEVTIAGGDQTLNLALQPALQVSGRVAFEASSLVPPADLSKTRVTLTPAVPALGGTGGTASAAANGDFTIRNVAPGRYQLGASLPVPSIESGWYVVSATINGQESLDGAVDIRPGNDVTGAVVTLTDRPTEIAGAIIDAAGNPAPEYFIIVFSTNEAHWAPLTRRILQARPSNDGTFLFRNLPPGEYRIAAVTHVEQGEWLDPAFLAQLVPASVKVTLPEHGKIRQDLQIR